MQDTLRNRILAELAHGRKMKAGQIIEVLRVQKDRVYRELAIAVELGYLVKHGQPPPASTCSLRVRPIHGATAAHRSTPDTWYRTRWQTAARWK